MILASPRLLAAICHAYCSIIRLTDRNATTYVQIGVVGGADGISLNVSDDWYGAGSRDPVPGFW